MCSYFMYIKNISMINFQNKTKKISSNIFHELTRTEPNGSENFQLVYPNVQVGGKSKFTA